MSDHLVGYAPLGWERVQLVAPIMRQGLHTKLTSETVEVLCSAVLAGIKPTRAVIAAGFSRNCWSNWCRQADADDEPYKSAVDAIRRAEAVYLATLEERVTLAGMSDWKASMAMLEKRLREEYGVKIDVTAKVGAIDPADVPDDQLAAIALGAAANEA